MPKISEITYSRETAIAALTDFYQFLEKMFTREDSFAEAPEGGWPSITKESMRPLGKDDEVIELMRHLPLPRQMNEYACCHIFCVPYGEFAEWQMLVDYPGMHEGRGDDVRIITEGYPFDQIPSSCFGLLCGGRDTPRIIVDTKFGIVHWEECPTDLYETTPIEFVTESFEPYTPDSEHNWRNNGIAWTIPDFFEMLKEEYRRLSYVPFFHDWIEEWPEDAENNEDRGEGSEGDQHQSDEAAMIAKAKKIYRECGWPDLSVFRKDECHDALKAMIKKDFPEEAWRYGDH